MKTNIRPGLKTSPEIMEAIESLATHKDPAKTIWYAPTHRQRLAVWRKVTHNGRLNSRHFYWGAAGYEWGIDI